MPNYANGKIYQVVSPNYPVPYIGSTTVPLCKRIVQHRASSNTCRSRIVIDAGDAYIELIEEYPCENKEQLNKREGEIIRQRECVNHKIPCRTRKEWKDDNKDYVYERNKAYRETTHNKANKAYREANRDAINARQRALYEANKEAEIARSKAYYEANRGAINARRRANRKKAKESIDVLQEQGEEDIHSQSNETPQPE